MSSYATRIIRRMEQQSGSFTPILALTASVMREDYEKCIRAGMNGVEAKPIDFNHLLTTIEKTVPAEYGRPNTNRSHNVEISSHNIDFSVLHGVMNYQKALKTWISAPVLHHSLCDFAAKHTDDAALISQLLADNPNNAEPARSVAHTLKGLAGNLALEQIAGLADTVDLALKHQQHTKIATHLDQLQQLLQRAADAIARLQAPEDSPAKKITAFDSSAVQQLLANLLSALEELNPDATTSIVQELGNYLTTEQLLPIQSNIELFEFDTAAEEVVQLATSLDISIQ